VSGEKTKQIGKRIRHIRKINKITQEQLAEMINVSVPYISNIENGKVNVGAEVIIRLAQALQVSADILLCLEITERDTKYTETFSRLTKQCASEDTEQLLKIMSIIIKMIEK